MTDKERYRSFCEEHDVPLFCQAWWMDAVCGDRWDVFLYEEGGRIAAVMPWHGVRRLGQLFVMQPQLTQFNGVWTDYSVVKDTPYDRLMLEKRAGEYFASCVKRLNPAFYLQAFHHSFVDWLPFFWQGFWQSTRYTYVIDDLSCPDKVLASFSSSRRRDVKAAMREGLYADQSLDGDAMYDFMCLTLKQRGRSALYRKELFLSIYNAAVSRGQGQCIGIRGADGELLAATFLVWDGSVAYLLLNAVRREAGQRNNAGVLAVWESVKFASGKSRTFDFEGSMEQDIEASYCKYGTRQVPYMQVGRYRSVWWEMLLRFLKK